MADKRANKEQQVIQRIFDGKRYFVMDDGIKFYIESPTADEVRQADWHYSKTYNEAFLAGVTTLAQMQEILEDRQVLGQEFEDRKEELQAILNEKIALLKEADDPQIKKELIVQVEAARTAFFRHNQKASSPLSNTCEQLAEDARIEHLAANMIVDEEGKRVWSGYEDYKTTNKQGLASRARYEIMLYLQGYESDFLANIPEAIARRQLEQVESDDEVLSIGHSDEVDSEPVDTDYEGDSLQERKQAKKRRK